MANPGERMTNLTKHRSASRQRSTTIMRQINYRCCSWVAVIVVILMATTLTIHAQPSYATIYENIVGSTKSYRKSIEIGLDRCLKCKHWKSCKFGDSYIDIPKSVVYAERLWEGLLAFASTLEVLVRGFTLGFGIRMLKYLFWETGASEATTTTDRASVLLSFRNKAIVSAVAGLSLAAFLHGSSIFVPAEVRKEWFVDFHHHSKKYHHHHQPPDSDVPLVLYQYIRRFVVATSYQNDNGTLDCPSVCDRTGEICNRMLHIDVTAYFLERIGTGLSYLATTLEVLLRGFSLGFGARMLKYLFYSNDQQQSKSESECERENESISESKSEQQRNIQSNVVLEEKENFLLGSFRHWTLVSAISGIAVSAVIHGSSLFVPTQLRDDWFDIENDWFFRGGDDLVSFLANMAFFLTAIFFMLFSCCGCFGNKKN